MPRTRLAVFDMAGTTVDDLVDGVPLVLKSYNDAFEAHGVYVPMEVLNEQRGRDKWTVISELGGDKAPKIYEDFLRILNANTGRVKEVEGASETFRFLKERGVVVYASTGFPEEVAEAMVEHLGWLRDGLIDGNGFICSSRKAFVDALIYLKENPDQVSKMGKRSRELVLKNWTWKKRAEEWITTIEALDNQ